MTDYPVIPASDQTPVVVPVTTTETKVYDRWWMKGFRCPAADPNSPVNAIAILVKGHKDENGVWELSPRPEDVVTLTIADIFTQAQTNQDIANALGLILGIVIAQGQAEGKL